MVFSLLTYARPPIWVQITVFESMYFQDFISQFNSVEQICFQCLFYARKYQAREKTLNCYQKFNWLMILQCPLIAITPRICISLERRLSPVWERSSFVGVGKVVGGVFLDSAFKDEKELTK